MKSKLEINKEADFHVLLVRDSELLQNAYNLLKIMIETIIKRDDLLEGNWYPSEDFKYLVKGK